MNQPQSGGLDRRTILKAGAWATPALILATAAPAAASQSGTPCADQGKTYIYDPRHYTGNGSMGPNHNIAKITVIVGVSVIVEYIKSYPHATAVTIDHKIVHKLDRVNDESGKIFTFPLLECQDPTFIQVDGNNVHYYGGGQFA